MLPRDIRLRLLALMVRLYEERGILLGYTFYWNYSGLRLILLDKLGSVRSVGIVEFSLSGFCAHGFDVTKTIVGISANGHFMMFFSIGCHNF